MRGQASKDKLVLGMDQRYRPEDYTASEISNFRVESEGLGWRNDRGWEPLIPHSDIIEILKPRMATYREPHRFLAVWSRHQNAEQYYLYEQNGRLIYEMGNVGDATDNEEYVILSRGRNLPKASDPGTQFAPFGKVALILNGDNAPLLFSGREAIRPFGWTRRPAAPTTLGVQPSHLTVATELDGESTCISFDPAGYLGLGEGTNGSHSRFGYRMAFVSDTGSISPLSAPTYVEWTIDSVSYEAKFGVVLEDLPIGPEGTVKRLLFRTKDIKQGFTDSEVYYLLDTIKENVSEQYVDIRPDSYLTEQVSLTDSVTITHAYKYATEFNGSMWLADNDQIIYSEPGLPEQFPAFNVFKIGVRTGGPITGLQKYGSSIIVFRANAIDVINLTSNGYSCDTITSSIGTIATNTVVPVPGFGVVFLTDDGFYAVKGTQRGGGTFKVEKVSVGLEREMSRLSTAALTRATAAYSSREKEYWCHYPTDGQTENSRGAVLHTLTGKWSLRNTMAFTQLAVDPQGYFIIGTKPEVTVLLANWTGYPGLGLQVWSARRFWGDILTYQTPSDNYYRFTAEGAPKQDSIWASPWNTVSGDDSTKKAVLSVEVEILTQGDNAIDLYHAEDGNWVWTGPTSQTPQVAEYAGSTAAEKVYCASSRVDAAIWDSTNWEGGKRTRLTFDVRTGLISTFKFQLRTTNLIHILGYKLIYVNKPTQRGMRR